MVIMGKNGLHLRPAGRISETALRFRSEITLEYNGGLSTANARSVLSLLAAGLQEGDEVRLCCRGSDERKACRKGVFRRNGSGLVAGKIVTE